MINNFRVRVKTGKHTFIGERHSFRNSDVILKSHIAPYCKNASSVASFLEVVHC